jgi:Holliday junction resolvase RusA-like endonuclease
MIVIEIGGEPKGKGRPRFARNGHAAYTPAATRVYKSAIRYVAQERMTGRPPFDGPLEITVTATFPIPSSWSRKKREAALSGMLPHTSAPDCDNLLKVCDALNQIIWRDDKQIVRATITKRYGEIPSLRIEVS